MADYPTPSDYQEAVQMPEAAFTDPELQSATPRTNVLGLPQPITGAFAAVFPMTTDADRRYAVKCFLKDVPEQRTRYEAVATHLDTVSLDALLDFTYQPDGIQVNGAAYPVLKMEWAEGTVLNRFVEAHLDAPDTLAALADAWAALMERLEAEDLAHGDLQHGNVLVQKDEDDLHLRLVDYDTMYVPALEGRSSAEVGHRNYQHPDRTDADFGPALDRFAGLVIYTALRACAARPSLWDRYDTGENLLFRDADFYNPDQSPLFDELAEMEATASLVEGLRTACYVEPADVPPLQAMREGTPSLDVAVQRRSAQARRSEAAKRPPFARYFLPILLAVLGVTVGTAFLVGPLVGTVVGGLGIMGAGVTVARRYHRLSLVRRRLRLEQEATRFTEAIRALRRELESLEAKREELLNSMDERRAERLEEVQEEALRDHLKHHFIGEVREIDGIIHKHVVRLKAANVRTAYEATPEAVADVRRISDEARTRINMWRSALARQYEDEVPDSLSPAEERRLRRYVENRVEDVEEQIARTQEKIAVQKTERDRVTERLDDMPTVTWTDYLRYLLRLGAFPDRMDGPPRPAAPPDPPDESEADPVPTIQSPSDDRPWWARRP